MCGTRKNVETEPILDLGERYRFLDKGELIKPGDEYYSPFTGFWHEEKGAENSDLFAGRSFYTAFQYRRKIEEPWDDLPIQSTKEIEDVNPMVQKLRGMRTPWPLPEQSQEDRQYDFKEVWNDIVNKLPLHLSHEMRSRFSNDIDYRRFEVGVSFNTISPILLKTTVVTITFQGGRSINGVANLHPSDVDTFNPHRGYRLALYRAALSVAAHQLAQIENYV